MKRLTAYFALLVTLAACAPATQLLTRPADPSAITGSFTVLLYGCHYPAQVENAVILVSEKSIYPLEIYDLDSSYRVVKGVNAEQALAQARQFLECSMHSLWQTEVFRIPDDKGGTIGFEVRPLYHPYDLGMTDVLVTSYALRDGTVRAIIRKNPLLRDDSGDSRDRDGRDGR